MRLKHTTSQRWFYGLVGLANLAVGAMFYVVNLQVSPPVASQALPVVSRTRPLPPRFIPAIQGNPTRIVLSSLAIDLNVSVGSYNPADNSWTTGPTNAYFADPSLPVNDSNGRTLIYGHAQPQVFGRLPEIQPGSQALVYTDNGYIFHYSYQNMHDVTPTDTTIFTADGPPTLILQTCAGNWDAYRAMFSFKFESVEHI